MRFKSERRSLCLEIPEEILDIASLERYIRRSHNSVSGFYVRWLQLHHYDQWSQSPTRERLMNKSKETEVDFGDQPASDDTPLEEKYREQMRQIVSQKIELPISTLPEMIKEQINLNPDFQRRDRWNVEKQSRFIESIIMNVPVPPVFLGENEYGNYVVLDGRQRLTAIHEFQKNAFQLKGLKVWAELNGLRFNDLQKKKLDKAITRRFVPAIVILKESSSEVKYDVFDRLNTGGVIAEPMEIRNAVYQGEFTKHLYQLSKDITFRKLWDIPLDEGKAEATKLYSKMGDLELVLRFFALQEYGKINLRFKDYLSEFMGQRNAEYKSSKEIRVKDTEVFSRAIKNSWAVFGKDAFKKPKPGADGVLLAYKSAPLSDSIMSAFSQIEPEKITPVLRPKLRAAIMELCIHNEAFRKSISTGTNGKGAIRTRIDLARTAVMRVLGN